LLLNAPGIGVGLDGVLGVLAGPTAEVAAPDDSVSDMFLLVFVMALTVSGSRLWFMEEHAERASRAQRLP
jgi:hypothetical protein